eukprot:15344126-Ditylum_brightwellii.AAC.1
MRWETDILGIEEEQLSEESFSVDDDRGDEISEHIAIEENWEEDAELLRSLVRHAPLMEGQRHVLKSYVGNMLRQTDSNRFANREDIKIFLAKAIEKGVVLEMGYGPNKTFRLPKGISEGSETEFSLEDVSEEEWEDDAELLRSIIRMDGQQRVLKSAVGSMLRQKNPSRFIHREDIKLFLAKAISRGVVVEMGYGPHKTLQLPPESEEEEWAEDLELLRSIICHSPKKEGQHQALKSLVGLKLKERNPSRFPNRDAIQSFMAKAIETGVVVEIGEGGAKILRMST